MEVSCSDAPTFRINPQLFHIPLNTAIVGYAHPMHNCINRTHLEYSPATLSVVPAQGEEGALGR
ncbi:hypothetical protein BST45_10445 [Mycobacterium shinjukuense]|nr:hypothetical protein BST45_10445 [Mycobacterium shinjukuense]